MTYDRHGSEAEEEVDGRGRLVEKERYVWWARRNEEPWESRNEEDITMVEEAMAGDRERGKEGFRDFVKTHPRLHRASVSKEADGEKEGYLADDPPRPRDRDEGRIIRDNNTARTRFAPIQVR